MSNPKFSKRHYEVLSEVLYGAKRSVQRSGKSNTEIKLILAGIYLVERYLIGILKSDNPSFKEGHFLNVADKRVGIE